MSTKNTTKNIKVIHGKYVENPKCKICGKELTHEWLDGDYSLLLCDSKECFDKYGEMIFKHE